jgi:hypothetical protein
MWAYRIGVPMPLSGVTEDTPEGRVRQVQWQKNVHFEEVITDWQPGRLLKWRYRFTPDSFPAGALDDHVMIGGQYFDLRDTTYTLTPRDGGTELRIDVSWRAEHALQLVCRPRAAGAAGQRLGEHPALLQGAQRRRPRGGGTVPDDAARLPAGARPGVGTPGRGRPPALHDGAVLRRPRVRPRRDERGLARALGRAADALRPALRRAGAAHRHRRADRGALPLPPRRRAPVLGPRLPLRRASRPSTSARTWNSTKRRAPR